MVSSLSDSGSAIVLSSSDLESEVRDEKGLGLENRDKIETNGKDDVRLNTGGVE